MFGVVAGLEGYIASSTMRRHHRQSVRLRGVDYGQPGLYFVTICAFGRQPVFGAVGAGEMHLSALGEIARDEWLRTPALRAGVALDAFVVMPDHVHLLFGIVDENGASPPVGVGAYCHTPLRDGTAVPFRSPSHTVGAIVRGYKGSVTRRIRQLDPTVRVWQRSYHDRIVRHPREAEAIRRYIAENSARWDPDADTVDGHRV